MGHPWTRLAIKPTVPRADIGRLSDWFKTSRAVEAALLRFVLDSNRQGDGTYVLCIEGGQESEAMTLVRRVLRKFGFGIESEQVY